jgi:hypothetical protein
LYKREGLSKSQMSQREIVMYIFCEDRK